MNFIKKISVFLFFGLCFAQCTPQIIIKDPPFGETFIEGVYIINEGSYNNGNASVSWYNPATKQVKNNIFPMINDGENLGDVLQSMTKIGDQLYLVVNNSQKIVVVAPYTFTKKQEIKSLNSPRYITPINSSQAYVSNLVLNNGTTAIQKIDLATGQIIGTIPSQFVEQMQQVPSDNNAVWAATINTNWLLRINTATDKVSDTVRLSNSPKYLFLDKNNVSIWAICEGDYRGGTPAICKINTQTKQIEQRFNLPQGSKTIVAAHYSSKYDCIYYIYDNKVWKMGVSDTQLPASPFIANAGKLPYGISVSPSGDVYVADAIDYQQKGKIRVFNANGNLKDDFEVGIIPSGFLFQ